MTMDWTIILTMIQNSKTGKSETLQPTWISGQAEVHRLAADLRESTHVAVDTESNSLFAFKEQVCLLQISSDREDFLIDTLELDDLSILNPLFSSPKIEKIFHAAEYDILCLKRDFGIEFHTIFDTMQAARILGIKEVGLGAILENEFGVTQDKKYQRANWGLRPLPANMLDYASRDTRYLIPLRDRLAERLTERGLMGLAREDFARLCMVLPSKGDGREPCWRVAGAQTLNPRERAILGELCALREELAEKMDRPPFKVLPNESLISIAQKNPATMDDLTDIPGLSAKLIARFGDDIQRAVATGNHSPAIPKPPREHRPADEFLARLDNLKKWRKETGRKMEVESDIILPREILETIATKNPQDKASLRKIMTDVPWRLEHFGDQILKITRNHQEVE
jgi:ribonuclease D